MMEIIVGIDEVGRGPLAGPVTVCVVSCEREIYKKLGRLRSLPPKGKDSKKISALDREKYCQILKILSKEEKLFYSVNHISNKIIDSKGLTFAIDKAVRKGINKLNLNPLVSEILLDGGLKAPKEFLKQKTIVKGDEKEKIIAWASIIAKVHRDNLMQRMAKKNLNYGFESNKGYGTKNHREMIEKYGLSPSHRRLFCRNLTVLNSLQTI